MLKCRISKWGVSAALALLVLCFTLGSASAILVDFRDASYKPDPSATSVTQDDILGDLDITITAYGVDAQLYWDAMDGFGVNSISYEDDEIENCELLMVSFSEKVSLASVLITDLFKNEDRRGTDPYNEIGLYALNLDLDTDITKFLNTGITKFNALDLTIPNLDDSNGQGTLAIGETVSSITFAAPGEFFRLHQDHEFSVAGVNITPVPEPATILLLGVGLAGLAGVAVPRVRRKE